MDNRIINQKNKTKNQKIGSENYSFPSRGRWCVAPDEVCPKGISLISLIITIIVIIILATIVIFNGFGATESAGFAKFAQDFSSYQEEMDQRFLDEKRKSLLRGENKKDSEIYAEIGDRTELLVADVIDGKDISLDGILCYKLPGDRRFYQGDEGTYITDKGKLFTMPGYKHIVNEEERYYVNGRDYYIATKPLMVIGGPVKVGDYVSYTPDLATYTNNEFPEGAAGGDYYLGHTYEVSFDTDTTTKWKVLRIEDTGEILITPENPVNELNNVVGRPGLLAFGPGYLNGVRVLNYICGKLYSCSALGTIARSMKVEDLDYSVSDGTTHYAYYSNSIEEAPDIPNVTINDVTYVGIRCASSKYSYWDYDEFTSGECKQTYTETVNGQNYTYSYAKPMGNKPVLVTEKNVILNKGTKTNDAFAVLGEAGGILASPFAYFGPDKCVYYQMRRVFLDNKLTSDTVLNSVGYSSSYYTVLRPVVTLGPGLKMEASGEVNGTTNWVISKAN